MCQRWAGPGGFDAFVEDMGPRPRVDMSLDRIDNEGDYEPDNCRWTTTQKQNRNTRANHRITIDGETMCLTAWAERYGIGRSTIVNRIRVGWDPVAAVTTPAGAFYGSAQRGKPKRCGNCGSHGHNRRSCDAA